MFKLSQPFGYCGEETVPLNLYYLPGRYRNVAIIVPNSIDLDGLFSNEDWQFRMNNVDIDGDGQQDIIFMTNGGHSFLIRVKI